MKFVFKRHCISYLLGIETVVMLCGIKVIEVWKFILIYIATEGKENSAWQNGGIVLQLL